MTGNKVLSKLRVSEVKVAVAKLQLVIYLVGVCYLKGSGLRSGEYTQLGNCDLNITCPELRVLALSLSDSSHSCKNVLALYLLSLFKHSSVGLVIEGKLYKPCPVTQINEDKVSHIPYSVCKAHNGNCLPYGIVNGAVVSTFKTLHTV